MVAKYLRHKFVSAVGDGADAALVRPISNWDDEHDLWFGTRSITGTSDTITDADHLTLLTYNNAGAIAAGIPAPAGGAMPNGWQTTVRNIGAGTVTITGAGGATIGGAASIAVPSGAWLELYSLGTADYVPISPVHRTAAATWTGSNDFQGKTNIKGVSVGGAAAASYVGQYIESVVSAPGNFISGGAYQQLTIGLSIPAGDWDVWGSATYTMSGNSGVVDAFLYLSSLSTGQSNLNDPLFSCRDFYPGFSDFSGQLKVGPARISLASAQNWFLVGWVDVLTGSIYAFATLAALRVR